MLKEIFEPGECAKCRLCCNFHRESVWESPYLTDVQAERLAARGVEIERRERGGSSFVFHFVDDEAANCPALDSSRGCSLKSDEKPFECSVWPLRTMERDGKLVVGRYRDCPALVGDRVAALERLATGKLLPVLLEFVRRNPESIRPFSPLYDVFWEGPLPTSIHSKRAKK